MLATPNRGAGNTLLRLPGSVAGRVRGVPVFHDGFWVEREALGARRGDYRHA